MDLLTRLKKEPLPFAALLGIEVVSAAPDKIVAEMKVRDEFCTRPAVLHGGAVMAFADTLGALGTLGAKIFINAATKQPDGTLVVPRINVGRDSATDVSFFEGGPAYVTVNLPFFGSRTNRNSLL